MSSPAAKQVLFVEDDPDFRALIQLMLPTSHGLHLATTGASTGGAALTALAGPPADLVILDLVLPDMSGWEVLIAMRARPEWAAVPVIILSSHGTRIDKSFGRQVARVHAYLTKPCLPSELRASVITALAG